MRIMADVAMVFHFPPGEMLDMDVDDLLEWHSLAVERLHMFFSS